MAMKILVTNDDGIDSPSLLCLAKWARQFGEVTVSAPKYEQSAKSHGIELHGQIEAKRVDYADGIEAYSVASTPADCVRFGSFGIGKRYDLVLSGINRGYNLGNDIVYSGTVGAVMEACGLGMRGIALSTHREDHLPAVSQLDAVYRFVEEKRLFEAGSVYNINIPPVCKGIRLTRQGELFYRDRFESVGKDLYLQRGEPIEQAVLDPDTDVGAVKSGYISVTPLTLQMTDLSALARLK